MAIQIYGADGSTLLKTDPAHGAARVSIRPAQFIAANSIGAKTGNITTIAAAGAIFSFRNIGTKIITVRRVGIGLILTTGFTAAQLVEYGLMVCRNWTVSSTGGTQILMTGSNGKMRTSLDVPTSLDCRISSTAAFTGETKSRDSNYLGVVAAYAAASAVGAIIAPSADNLLSQNAGDHPLILEQNEGFSIENVVAMGAGGVGVAYVNIEFGEMDTY